MRNSTLGAIANNQKDLFNMMRGGGQVNNENTASFKNQVGLSNLMKTGSAKVFGTEGNVSEQTGTSIFDPVLCELVYKWFNVVNGNVLDPFAGGSVRGIVAEYLGYKYIGIDLSQPQIEANRTQAEAIGVNPTWIVGDSRNVKEIAKGEYDLVFSCPPYYDLEVYSDDTNDLSVLGTYEEFINSYQKIISDCVSMLKDNRFACFVVGDIRDKKGFYRNFVSDTIKAFQDAGALLYNEGILVTVAGSLPVRCGRPFVSGRKLGKTHQNVLVFYKGDPSKIKDNFSEDIEIAEMPTDDMVAIKISAKMARLAFNGCDLDYIANICHASCCEQSKGGIMVTIHPSEKGSIESIGGVVDNGLLQADSETNKCPFKKDNLCSLHNTENKPFGCIASPFTLNANGTLIVRNRYKLLKCYNDGNKIPAYKAFRASLDLILGYEEAERVCDLLDEGSDDIVSHISKETYNILIENDQIKHQDSI
mgnify:CR=1 FL=1